MLAYAKKVQDLICLKRDAVAILAPPEAVRAIGGEFYLSNPEIYEDKLSCFMGVGRGSGVVGYLYGLPLVVAPDSVLRVVNFSELKEYAVFLGIDLEALADRVVEKMKDR